MRNNQQQHEQALERYRKSGGPLKCKQCVGQAEAQEREQAAAKRLLASSLTRLTTTTTTNDGKALDAKIPETKQLRTCAACQASLDNVAYNRNQWNKGEGKSKCRTCVEQQIEEESQGQVQTKAEAIAAVQFKSQQLQEQQQQQSSGTSSAKAILQAESELAALQAQQVTGLKPIRLGSRGGGRNGRGKSSTTAKRGGRSGGS